MNINLIREDRVGYDTMHNPLNHYKIGLLALSVLLLILLGYVIISSAGQRQDNITEAKAQLIADKLNDYTLDESAVPENLAELKIDDVPNTITYEKKNDTTYEFCATYTHASNDTPATSLGDVVSGAALGGYGAGYGGDDYQSDTYLTIGSHTKGKNCQTIQIYGNYKSPIDYPIGGCEYDYDSPDSANDAYYNCLKTQIN